MRDEGGADEKELRGFFRGFFGEKGDVGSCREEKRREVQEGGVLFTTGSCGSLSAEESKVKRWEEAQTRG